MITFTDFERDGNVDWKAYEQARRNAGELCRRCGGYIVGAHRATGPRDCGDCMAMGRSGEVAHSTFVRCPACGHAWDVRGGVDDWAQEGEHGVYCGNCEHEFEFVTVVSFSFRSPPRLKDGDQ